MISIEGFRDCSKIYEGEKIILYRALCEDDGTTVILKQFKEDGFRGAISTFLRRKNENEPGFMHDGIVKLLKTSGSYDNPVLVLEDFEGDVPAKILYNGEISVEVFLKIAYRLAEILDFIHGKGIILQYLNPEDIFINPDDGDAKISSINLYIGKTSKDLEIRSIDNIYDAAYISPEMTGRVKQEVDHRTDLYSLGVIFYEMLSGRLPFESRDYLELIHSHIAREAVPVCQLNEEVPKVLSDIICKLMQKKTGDRYQTANGLRHDLLLCIEKLELKDNRFMIEHFPIGEDDAEEKLTIPKDMLGREKEVKYLIDEFYKVKSESPRIVLVSGPSGVGKTRLVSEIVNPVRQYGGLFIQGKFDQYKKSTPYEAFIHAFEMLFKEILSQERDKILEWKEKIDKALGENAGIVTPLFQRLEKIIGKKEQVEDLPFIEAQNRLNIALLSLFHILASEEKPLVIFIDDLQWADSSSINLLKLIFSRSEKFHILFIGAYRVGEVTETHILNSLIKELERNKSIADIIKLEPLSLEYVRKFVFKALQLSEEKAEILSRVCYEKTGGNPFFLHHFIKSLKDEGLIFFDRFKKHWEIALDEILKPGSTDDVVELMVKKIEKLHHRTIEVLKLASCMDNTFDAAVISGIQGISCDEAEEILKEAVREGMVIPDDYSSLNEEKGKEVPAKYRFTHDRVQQAASTLIGENRLGHYHYIIGKYLLEKCSGPERSQNLLEITDYLNSALDIVTKNNEVMQLTSLNLQAGNKAKTVSAYERALEYFLKGISLLGNDCWSSAYNMTLELYTEAFRASYVRARYGLMDELGNTILKKGRSIFDKAAVYEIRISYLTAQNRFKDAIDTSRYILKQFGIKIPEKPSFLNISILFLKIMLAIKGRRIEELKNIPEMKNEKYLAIMRLLTGTGMAGYTFSSPVMLMLTLNVVYISLKHGTAPSTPTAYAGFGYVLSAYLKRRDMGYRFGKLAMELQSGMKSKSFECITNLLFEILLRHNKEHIRNTLMGFPNNYKSGVNVGDLTSAGHIMLQHFAYIYLSGYELSYIKKQMEEYMEDFYRTGNKTAIYACSMFLQGIINLMDEQSGMERVDEGVSPWILKGEYFDEDEVLPLCKEANDRTVIFCSYLNKMLLSYIYGRYDEALGNFEKAEEYLDGVIGTYCVPVYYFYGALLYLELLSSAQGMDIIRYKRKIHSCIREVKSFNKDAPQNNSHKYFLIRAEQARVFGRIKEAELFYRKSIKSAGENKFLQEEALSNELAARFFRFLGMYEKAGDFAREAAHCYSEWGCTKKAEELVGTYDIPAYPGLNRKADQENMAGLDELTHVDLETIIRASQAISEEIVLQDLLKKMIYILLQNAGARRALFITESDGELYIEAEGKADDGRVDVMEGVHVKGNPEVFESIVYYAANTRESVVLNNEAEVMGFTGSRLSGIRGVKSLLCVCLWSQNTAWQEYYTLRMT